MIAHFVMMSKGEISEKADMWRDGAIKAQKIMDALMSSAAQNGEVVALT
jgi:hypothetical protein